MNFTIGPNLIKKKKLILDKSVMLKLLPKNGSYNNVLNTELFPGTWASISSRLSIEDNKKNMHNISNRIEYNVKHHCNVTSAWTVNKGKAPLWTAAPILTVASSFQDSVQCPKRIRARWFMLKVKNYAKDVGQRAPKKVLRGTRKRGYEAFHL